MTWFGNVAEFEQGQNRCCQHHMAGKQRVATAVFSYKMVLHCFDILNYHLQCFELCVWHLLDLSLTTSHACLCGLTVAARKMLQQRHRCNACVHMGIWPSLIPRPPHPAFVTCKWQKLGVKAWERGYIWPGCMFRTCIIRIACTNNLPSSIVWHDVISGLVTSLLVWDATSVTDRLTPLALDSTQLQIVQCTQCGARTWTQLSGASNYIHKLLLLSEKTQIVWLLHGN